MKHFNLENRWNFKASRFVWLLENGSGENMPPPAPIEVVPFTDENAKNSPDEKMTPEKIREMNERYNQLKDKQDADAKKNCKEGIDLCKAEFKADLATDPLPPNLDDPDLDLESGEDPDSEAPDSELADAAPETTPKPELSDEAKTVVAEKFLAFFNQNLEILKEGDPGSAEVVSTFLENNKEKLNSKEAQNHLASILSKVLSPEEINAINANPDSFQPNEGFITRLSNPASKNSSEQAPNQEGGEDNSTNEQEKAARQAENKKLILEDIHQLTPEHFIPEAKRNQPMPLAEAYVEWVQQNAETLANDFKEFGPKAAQEAIDKGFGDFVGSMKNSDIRQIRNSGEPFEVDENFEKIIRNSLETSKTILVQKTDADRNAAEQSKATKEEAESVLKNIIAFVKMFKEGLTPDEFLEAIGIILAGENPAKVKPESAEYYSRTMGAQNPPLNFESLLSLSAEPAGEFANQLFGPAFTRFRGDAAKEANKMMTNRIGVETVVSVRGSSLEGVTTKEIEFLKGGREYIGYLQEDGEEKVFRLKEKAGYVDVPLEEEGPHNKDGDNNTIHLDPGVPLAEALRNIIATVQPVPTEPEPAPAEVEGVEGEEGVDKGKAEEGA